MVSYSADECPSCKSVYSLVTMFDLRTPGGSRLSKTQCELLSRTIHGAYQAIERLKDERDAAIEGRDAVRKVIALVKDLEGV
jgi:hypothetical protein